MYPASYRFPRLVLEPFAMAGQNFAAGDLLSLNLAGAGRDPARFAEPDRFDPRRRCPGFDIGFGFGNLEGELRVGSRIEVAGEPTLNEWNGRISVELELKDLKLPSAG